DRRRRLSAPARKYWHVSRRPWPPLAALLLLESRQEDSFVVAPCDRRPGLADLRTALTVRSTQVSCKDSIPSSLTALTGTRNPTRSGRTTDGITIRSRIAGAG